MQNTKLTIRVVGAAVGVLGVLAVGSAGMAWAQESPSTEPPAARTPATDGSTRAEADTDKKGCDKDGDGQPDNSDATAADQTSL